MATILVVDDSPVILRMVAFTLRKTGHQVITADHGLSALMVLENNDVDLIISDINMPYKDGISLLNDLKDKPETATIPFIFYTANREISTAERHLAYESADRVLSKPTSSLQITDSVNALLLKSKKIA
ncbi:MAG: response regulator [Chloroflexota bacterium]